MTGPRDLPHLDSIPAPVDAVGVGDWEVFSTKPLRASRAFQICHYHIPGSVMDDDGEALDETIVFADGYQDEDGSARRHIKVVFTGEMPCGEWVDGFEVARYGAAEARRVAVRMLLAAEQIADTEGRAE